MVKTHHEATLHLGGGKVKGLLRLLPAKLIPTVRYGTLLHEIPHETVIVERLASGSAIELVTFFASQYYFRIV